VRLAVAAAGLHVLILAAPALAAPEPFGVVEQTLGRFDRDTLVPIGVSANPGPGAGPGGRVGLWIVEPSRMQVEHAVQTRIAAEAVAYPGVVAALLQNGRLITVNPRTGAITARHAVGYSSCAPPAVQLANGRKVGSHPTVLTAIRLT
jgi:hypothetical protein